MASVNTTQIAQKLNLSRNTISKALNNNPEVNEKTRQIVMETAIQMGYKKLKQTIPVSYTQESGYDICLLVHESELTHFYWGVILKGIEEYITAMHGRIIFGILTNDDENNDHIPLAIRRERPAGIITIGTHNEHFFRKIKNTEIPMVAVDTASTIKDNCLIHDTILTCNNSSVYEITEHLIQGGYKDIAFVGNPDRCKSTYERWLGYKTAMLDHQMPVVEENKPFLQIDVCDETPEVILDSISHLPEAFVCVNDNIAVKLIKYYKKRGIRIPEDVAISGFDNLDSVNADLNITTVSYNIKDLGIMAARQILFRIENPLVSMMIVRLESKVIYKNSTKTKQNLT